MPDSQQTDSERVDIAILMAPEAIEFRDALCEIPEFQAESFRGSAFDGADVQTVIVSVSSAVLTALTTILVAYWKRCIAVKIEVDGVKIHGANPDDVKAIVTKILSAKRKQP